MNINEILDLMTHDIGALNFGQKMFGGLVVTVLSMAIVFAILILLMGVIKLLEKSMGGAAPKEVAPEAQVVETEVEYEEDMGELVAVISAAVASSMGVSESSIRVVNIARLGESSPSWARSGRLEQIQSRL